MEGLKQDIRYALRKQLGQPGFTVMVVIALALGIGANTAIFSMVNAVLLRQLPFREPGQLISISSTGVEDEKSPFSIPDFLDYQSQNETLQDMVAFAEFGVNLSQDGDPERMQGVRISANVFRMLGVNAAIGRTLVPEDDKQSGERVVVLTHGLWQRRFGSDPGLVGKTLTFNNDNYTVVGVMPPEFVFPRSRAEVGFPLVPDGDSRRSNRGDAFLRVIARLKPGITPERARADLDSIARRLQTQYPVTNARATGVSLTMLHDEVVGNYRMALLVLFTAVGLVLLIACTNLAILLLARASVRRREIAIRTALGATRARMIRQLLTESVLLAILGGLAGLGLTKFAVIFLLKLVPADLPRVKEINIDIEVLLFTLALSMLAGVLFGLAPAIQASKVNLNDQLKGTSLGSIGGVRQNRTYSILVVAEIAISLVLLISAGLFVKSFIQIQAVNPGFDTEHLLVVRLALPKYKYSKREAVNNFFESVEPRVKNLPGVQSVSAISILPLSGLVASIDFTIVGRPPVTTAETPVAQYRMIAPDYFRTMNIPILSGREFTGLDRAQTLPVAIVNQTLARRYWPDSDPVGSHLKVQDGAVDPREVEIIGVVGNVRQKRLDDEPTADIYVPLQQVPERTVVYLTNNMFLTIRASGPPLALAGAVKSEVQSVDRDVPATSTTTMEQFLSASVAPRRFNLLLVGVFASAGLLLAAAGLYSVIAYAVSQRKREIGIRMALGAQRRDVFRLVVGNGIRLVLVGVVAGLIGSFAVLRIMSSLLFGVTASDPSIYIFASLLLLLIGLLASFVPARSATKVNPLIALRSE
ncbi:MAG: ABC transporter permease [Blastocatellia bacterium]